MSAWDKVEASVDRFNEAHFYIHMMEAHYHRSDPFRYSLASFMRALKEVPAIVSMELQNEDGFVTWNRPERERLRSDALISHLNHQRDVVVHRQMLLPSSTACIGLTEGRGVKLGMQLSVDPRVDSDEMMLRYLHATAHDGNDVLGLLRPDEDSLPCVQREWRIPRLRGRAAGPVPPAPGCASEPTSTAP